MTDRTRKAADEWYDRTNEALQGGFFPSPQDCFLAGYHAGRRELVEEIRGCIIVDKYGAPHVINGSGLIKLIGGEDEK